MAVLINLGEKIGERIVVAMADHRVHIGSQKRPELRVALAFHSKLLCSGGLAASRGESCIQSARVLFSKHCYARPN